MLIFGGNTHNDTSLSNGAKCFSADFLAYDIGMYSSLLMWVLSTTVLLSQLKLMWVFKVLIPNTFKLFINYMVKLKAVFCSIGLLFAGQSIVAKMMRFKKCAQYCVIVWVVHVLLLNELQEFVHFWCYESMLNTDTSGYFS